MSSMITHFHFLQPLWLLLLLPLPLLLWWLLRASRGRAQWSRVADADMLPLLLAPDQQGRNPAPWLLSLVWLLLGIAMAGPAWERLPTPLEPGHGARVIVLSLADSMLASDIKPDRLTRARFKIRDLLTTEGDGQSALVAYAGDAFVVAPLTADSDTVLNLLVALQPNVMPVDGSNASRGIDKAVDLLRQAGIKGGDVLLVTDSADAGAISAARRALENGMHVSVLAVGTGSGSPVLLPGGGFLKDAKGNIVIPRLQASMLRQLAAAGGGVYQDISTDNADVQTLLAARHDSRLSHSDKSMQTRRWRDGGPWLLLLLVPLAALGFRRGWLMVLALVLMVPAPPARAGNWQDLWRNHDQQAAAALAAGKPEKAEQSARSPGLRGSAAYRAGHYDQAEANFARDKSAQAKYNLGNALARQGKFAQAVAAWNQALAQNPDLADARANRKAVEDWLKQRKKKQRQQEKQGGKQPQGQPKGKQPSAQQNKDKTGQKSGQGKPAQDTQQQQGNKDQQQKSGQPKGRDQQDRQQHHAQDKPGGKPASSGSSRPAQPAPALSSEPLPQAADAEQARQQRDETRKAELAVKKALDKQMHKPVTSGPHLLTHKTEPYDKNLPQVMRQQLQRVPDDPGGLLRRKFMLEYQQRQQEGGGS